MAFERRKIIEMEGQKSLAVEEKERIKALHFMKCPKCGMGLIEMDFRGIKVDKCSACEGVWLDAGELDAVAGLGENRLDGLFSAFKRWPPISRTPCTNSF